MIITTEAVVLHSRKYGDTSNILNLYTREQGRVSVIVKGARRPKSKFGSAIMPLNIADVSYYYKPGRELHTLSQAETTLSLRRIADSYTHLSVAFALCEAVLITQPVAERNASLYELLRACLVVLNDAEQNVYSFFAFFCIHLAEVMGFMMDFSGQHEVERSEHVDAKHEQYFSFDNGAILSGLDAPTAHSYRLSTSVVDLLRTLSSISILNLGQLRIHPEQQRELQLFFVNYFSHHLERRVVFRAEHIVLGEHQF